MFSFFQGNVRVLTVCRLLLTMSQSLAWPYFSLYVLALGGTATDVGFVSALGGVAGLFFYPVGGYVADKRGRVQLIGLSTFLFALSFIIFVVAWSWEILAIGRFARQLVMFYMPALNAIMVDSLDPSRRGIGFATVMAIPGAVGVVIPYVGGYIIDTMFGGDVVPAMRFSFAISFGLAISVAFIRLKFLRETMSVVDEEYSLRNVRRVLRDAYASVIETIRWLPRTLRMIAIIEMVTTFFVAMVGPFWVIFASQVVGISASEWGLLMLVAGGVRILLSIPFGYLIDRFGARTMIVGIAPLAPLATFLFPWTHSVSSMLGVFLLLALYNTVTWPAYSTLMAKYIPTARRGRVLAILGQGVQVGWGSPFISAFLLFIPGTIGPFLGGVLYDFEHTMLWNMLTGALLICLLLTIKFVNEPDAQHRLA
jgi:MFS family permease